MTDEEPLIVENRSTTEAHTDVAHVDVSIGGSYTSVLMAIFGGIEGSVRGECIHPLVMMICCIPVFSVQVTAMCFLRRDLAIDRETFHPDDKSSVSLLRLKWIMVVVLFVMHYKNIRDAVSHLILLMNPLTWVELKQPTSSEWRWASKAKCWWVSWLPGSFSLLFSGIVALGMKYIINYIVCADSVSIILSASSAQDIIFNGLAVSFVSDLSEAWWKVLSHVFLLHYVPGFRFERLPGDVWDHQGKLTDERKENASLPWLVNLVSRCTTRETKGGMKRSILSLGHGGNRSMDLLTHLILACIYGRQFFVILHAHETRRLPAARDLCSEYQVLQEIHEFEHWMTWWDWFHAQLAMLSTGLALQVERIRQDDTLREDCIGEHATLERLNWTIVLELSKKYLEWVVPFFVICFFLIVFPVTYRCFFGVDKIRNLEEERDNHIQRLNRDVEDMEDRMQQQQDKIEKRLEELKEEGAKRENLLEKQLKEEGAKLEMLEKRLKELKEEGDKRHNLLEKQLKDEGAKHEMIEKHLEEMRVKHEKLCNEAGEDEAVARQRRATVSPMQVLGRVRSFTRPM